MKQSGYLKREEVEKQTLMDISGQVNRQMMADCFSMMLHDAESMEGRPLGPKKIQRLMGERLPLFMNKYYDAFLGGDEADVEQEHMDRELKIIYQEKFEPFAVRYPYIRELFYGLRGNRKSKRSR